MYEQNIRYQWLDAVGVLVPNDKFEKKTMNKSLDIPITVPLYTVIGVYEKLTTLQKLLSNEPNVTHQKILSILEPLLYKYYANVLSTTKYPLEAQRALYHGNYLVLQTSPPREVKKEDLTNSQPLEVVIKEFISKMDLSMLDPNGSSFSQLINILATKFAYIRRTPFSLQQLSVYLLNIAKTADDKSLSLFELVIRFGVNINATDDNGKNHYSLFIIETSI